MVLEEAAAAKVPEPPAPVTETSAPVVLESPAPVLETEATVTAPEPPTPAAVSDTLPTEPRRREATVMPESVTDRASSDPISPDPASSDLSSTEPPQTTDEEEDSETVRLQREVDSALASLDSNLDEALAESAAFTESSSLQTQSRVQPPPAAETETETEAEMETEETTHETLPVAVKETPKVAPEAPKAAPEALKTASEAPKAVQEAPEVVKEKPKVVTTSRETVQETQEVIETLLPVARVAAERGQRESSEPRQSPAVPPAAARPAGPGSQDKDIDVVAELQQTSAPMPTSETVQETSLPETPRTAAGRSPEPAALRGKRTPKLGPASRQRPVEVQEEVVLERVEKVQRNRVSTEGVMPGLCLSVCLVLGLNLLPMR